MAHMKIRPPGCWFLEPSRSKADIIMSMFCIRRRTSTKFGSDQSPSKSSRKKPFITWSSQIDRTASLMLNWLQLCGRPAPCPAWLVQGLTFGEGFTQPLELAVTLPNSLQHLTLRYESWRCCAGVPGSWLIISIQNHSKKLRSLSCLSFHYIYLYFSFSFLGSWCYWLLLYHQPPEQSVCHASGHRINLFGLWMLDICVILNTYKHVICSYVINTGWHGWYPVLA